MKTVVKKLYEAMFLVNAEQATDWEGINKTIKKILKRSKAEIVSIKKWDERKLAYEIKGQDRGTYILCYFKADAEKIQDIERDVHLSEQLMRVLILNAEARDKEDIEKDFSSQRETSAEQTEQQEPKQTRQATQEAEAEHVDAQEETEQTDEKQQEEENGD